MTQLDTTKDSKALYIQIKEIYRNDILSQKLKRGDKIDSELEIQKKFGVSRITARQAVLDLEKEGMVKRSRGKGTFVIWRPGLQIPLDNIISFTKEMKQQGITPGTSFREVSIEPMDQRAKEAFKDASDEPMLCLKRVRTVDDIKVVYSVDYFPVDVGLPNNEEEYEESIYLMFNRLGVTPPQYAQDRYYTQLPNSEVVKLLNITENQPVLVRERIGYDENKQIKEYTISYFRGDLYSYTNFVERKPE